MTSTKKMTKEDNPKLRGMGRDIRGKILTNEVSIYIIITRIISYSEAVQGTRCQHKYF